MFKSSTGQVESSIERVLTSLELPDWEEEDEAEEEVLEEEEDEVDDEKLEDEVVLADELETEDDEDEIIVVDDTGAEDEEVDAILVVDVVDVDCKVAKYAPVIITTTIMIAATAIIGLLIPLWPETSAGFINSNVPEMRLILNKLWEILRVAEK